MLHRPLDCAYQMSTTDLSQDMSHLSLPASKPVWVWSCVLFWILHELASGLFLISHRSSILIPNTTGPSINSLRNTTIAKPGLCSFVAVDHMPLGIACYTIRQESSTTTAFDVVLSILTFLSLHVFFNTHLKGSSLFTEIHLNASFTSGTILSQALLNARCTFSTDGIFETRLKTVSPDSISLRFEPRWILKIQAFRHSWATSFPSISCDQYFWRPVSPHPKSQSHDHLMLSSPLLHPWKLSLCAHHDGEDLDRCKMNTRRDGTSFVIASFIDSLIFGTTVTELNSNVLEQSPSLRSFTFVIERFWSLFPNSNFTQSPTRRFSGHRQRFQPSCSF